MILTAEEITRALKDWTEFGKYARLPDVCATALYYIERCEELETRIAAIEAGFNSETTGAGECYES